MTANVIGRSSGIIFENVARIFEIDDKIVFIGTAFNTYPFNKEDITQIVITLTPTAGVRTQAEATQEKERS